MKKRLIAFLLVLIMVLGMLPVSALAADGDATKNTSHLIHEFNYVGGSRWDIEATTAAESYQIDVNTGKPTRDRYKFDGWADEANATTATYFGGELITLTKDNPTKIIYAVWKPIFELHYNANGGTGAPDSQTYTSYSATSTQATFTSRNQIPTKDGYTFKGWADSAAATTAQYQPGGTIPVKHENSPKTVYAVWEKNDSPVPDNPGGTKPDVANAQVKICVQCIEDSATHQPKNYGILPGAYVDGLLQVDGTYYYSITLNRAKYIEKFDQDSGKTHTDTEPNESIQFKWQWKNGKWELISDIAPVIKCQCEKQVEEKYTVTYTDGVDGKFFEDVVFSDLKSGVATPAFGKDPYHPGYTFAGWEPVVAATVTETVTYVAKWTPVEPKAPTADKLKKLEMAVLVKCDVDDAQQHTEAYGLLGYYNEDYIVGEPKKVGNDWLCDISYDPDPYVAAFNKAFPTPKHIQNDEKIVPVTLIWADGSWQLKTQGSVHVTEEYTVTFNAYGGFPTPDKQHVKSGEKAVLPSEPTLKGHTFAFWYLGEDEQNATAYDFDTPVTGDITLYANWKKNIYTVTYTDGVDGEEVFADQTYRVPFEDTTPAFKGTKTRDGYVFDGWKPAFSDTVTGNVTYVAQWTARTDLSYTVHYYLKNTTKQVANDKMVAGQTFNADVTENAIRISGYRVYGDSVKSITIGTGTNEIIFYYTRAYHPSTPSKPTLNTGDHYAYVMGYPDGTVRPNGSITRAEVSAILFRLLSDETRDEYFTTESSFTDVKAGAWYNNSIATLEKAGVIVDTAKGGAFRPNEAITRAELAAMLAQFSDAKPVKGVKFSDVSAEHWAYEAIAIAAKMGWIEGYPDGTFRPDATITRAEMMTLVNRALERVPSDEDHLLSKRVMLTFPDCKSGDWFYIAVQEATNSHTYERAATEKNGDEQWTALRANRDWTQLEK